MHTLATWRERPISLQEFMAGGGMLAAKCGARHCDAVTPIRNTIFFEDARGASVARLEDGVRCTCGGRGGALTLLTEAPATPSKNRVYLFHG